MVSVSFHEMCWLLYADAKKLLEEQKHHTAKHKDKQQEAAEHP